MAAEEAQTVAHRLLTEPETCTLATATTDGHPEAATIRYVGTEDYTVYFNTGTTYRKYDNLTENGNTAVVITANNQSLQIEGTATELAGDAAAAAEERYVEKYGRSNYLTAPDSTMFRIDPEWVRVLVDARYPPDYVTLLGE